EDVGLSPGDLAAAAEETNYVAGLESGAAASGDPSPVTALGVYRGILECAKRAYDTDDLNGKRVAVQGVGSVGGGVCLHLAKAGADLIVSDVHQETLSEIASLTGATIVSPDEIYDQDADIFSPNALGAVVNQETLGRLKAKVIAGGANNQLATRDMGAALSEAGVLYAPDYVINGGGIINVAAEISGNYSRDWVDDKLDTLMDTLGTILDQSLAEARPTNEIADEVARQRVGRQ
ncbi:MAG: Glu/Leu/Phe/Val dehydrogenase family protein, partial [Pseudomonadota bacterium]